MQFLIVDAHTVLRERVSAVLRHNFAESIVHVASDEAQALRVAKRHKGLDVILIDLDLAGGHGARLVVGLAKQTSAPVIAMALSEGVADIRRVLKLGAKGYLPKSTGPSTLAAVVRLVADGETYVPPVILGQLGSEPGASPAFSLDSLTPRQRQVLTLLAAGHRNGIIADRLKITEKTVKTHVTAVFRALGVSSRHEAANIARAQLEPL